eukprot:2748214-Amphidinium_carterae.1
MTTHIVVELVAVSTSMESVCHAPLQCHVGPRVVQEGECFKSSGANRHCHNMMMKKKQGRATTARALAKAQQDLLSLELTVVFALELVAALNACLPNT